MIPAPPPPDEAARLAALRSYEILDTEAEEAFDQIVRLAARLTGSPIALVSLVDAGRQWFKARHGLDPAETPRDLAFCAHAILEPDRPLSVPDATADPRFAGNPLVTGAPDIRAYLGVPRPSGSAQGFLFAPPMSADDLRGWLARHAAAAAGVLVPFRPRGQGGRGA